MLNAGDGVIAGLSGGPDSVCLFHALCSLRDELKLGPITAVHINHCLRGEESDGDEVSARQLAEGLGAEFIAFRYDVAAIAEKTGESTETAGRRLRYEAFERVRKEKGAARIAVAHNRNDQAETVLMRILRGTGLRGLGGIEYKRPDGIVIRPVLDLSRDQIEEYCRDRGLTPRIDHTNNQAIYTRNKIRLNLLPYLAREFNPSVSDALVRLSRQAREDEDFIMSAALGYIGEDRWNQKDCSLLLEGFEKLHPAAAKRVVLYCAAQAGMDQNMSAVNLEDAVRLAREKAEARETDLADGFYARVSYGKLWILRRSPRDVKKTRGPEDKGPGTEGMAAGKPECGSQAEKTAEEPGIGPVEVTLPLKELESKGSCLVKFQGLEMKLTLAQTVTEDRGRRKDGKIRLDFDRLLEREPVTLRHRRPGDRIRPLGMRGSKKLQDFFTDRKVPKHMRDTMPLLVSGGRVVAAGHEVTSECPVSLETTRTLFIEY